MFSKFSRDYICNILGEIKKNWRDTYWLKLNVHRAYFRLIGNKGASYIMNEQWDNLIILDACRYDFAKRFFGATNYRISLGSSTPEFLIKNFMARKFLDTVYVTANPYVDKLVKNSFYKVISVWKTEWNKKINTVHPKSVFKYALYASKKYPDKKLIIHFMQPHIPFIENPELTSQDFFNRFKTIEKGKNILSIETPWTLALKGKLDIKTVWRAYERNLKIVLPYAINLAKKLKGKNIITADHGNAFRRLLFPVPIIIAGHPSGIYIPDLVKVPWIVIDNGKKEIIPGSKVCDRDKIRNVAKKLRQRKRTKEKAYVH